MVEIRERIPNVALYQWSELPDTSCLEGAIDLNPEISSVDSGPLDTVAHGTPRDKLIYIYTSGTTGMPKAAVITNLRYDFLIFISLFFQHLLRSFYIKNNLNRDLKLALKKSIFSSTDSQKLNKQLSVSIKENSLISSIILKFYRYRCVETTSAYTLVVIRELLSCFDHRFASRRIND